MSSTTPPTTSSQPQAATNTQVVEDRVGVAVSSAESRTTEVITSSAAAAGNNNSGGSTGGRSADLSDGEVVIELNSPRPPAQSCAWGMLAGVSGLTAVVSCLYTHYTIYYIQQHIMANYRAISKFELYWIARKKIFLVWQRLV